MITIYLLKGCIHCQVVINRLKETCNRKICVIFVDKSEVMHLKIKDKRFKSFPIAFTGSPRANGNPSKKSVSLTGSNKIINVISKLEESKKKQLRKNKNKFGKENTGKEIMGNEMSISYELNNEGNIKFSDRRVPCFGSSCQVLNRVHEPCNSFGKKLWFNNQIDHFKPNIKKANCKYSLEEIGFNIPMSNHFGNCKDNILTYAAGSGGINPVTGKNYYNDEKPNCVQNYRNSYIHCDKNIEENPNKLMGINKYGNKNSNTGNKNSNTERKVTKYGNTKGVEQMKKVEIPFKNIKGVEQMIRYGNTKKAEQMKGTPSPFGKLTTPLGIEISLE